MLYLPFTLKGTALVNTLLVINKLNRSSPSGIFCPLGRSVVFHYTLGEIVRNASIEGVITATKDIHDVILCYSYDICGIIFQLLFLSKQSLL
jgi:hypothetical protein